MLTLYKYLRESIFDDEDIVSMDSDRELLTSELNNLPNKYREPDSFQYFTIIEESNNPEMIGSFSILSIRSL